MQKLLILWQALHEGYEVTDPQKWKNGTIKANSIAVLLSAILMFIDDTSINNEQITTIAAGIIAGVNIVMHILTSKKVGLSSHNDNSTNQE